MVGELNITTSFGSTQLDHYPLDAKFSPSGDHPYCCWNMEEAESDIASREDVIAFLHESYWELSEAHGLYVNKLPRTVRVANYDAVEGTVPKVLRAIDNINAWLPWEKHLTMRKLISGDTWLPLYAAFREVEDARSEFNELEFDRLAELAFPGDDFIIHIDPEYGGCGSAGARTITVSNNCVLTTVFQHELLHLVSADGSRTWDGMCQSNGGNGCNDHAQADPNYVHVPVSRFPESEMAYATPHDPTHGLSQIDGEVLQAIHTRESHWKEINFDPNIISDRADYFLFSKHDLGPWDDTVIRYEGSFSRDFYPAFYNFIEPKFGSDWRNGIARPWTNGEITHGTFAESGLSGSATWNGELVGFTPRREAVHGDSAIQVDLAGLNGSAAFTGLEHWSAGEPPGSIGTGMRWGDGDLHYSINLDGNYLRSTTGDEGYVSGRFVGERYEGAVGILEHPDLAAGWGALR